MKLFGLIEQMHIYSIFPLEPIVPPHSHLFETLEQYKPDKNLSVGLQLDSTKKVLKISPLEFHNQEIYLELFEYFNNLGRKIHFLESREHFESLAEIARKAIKIQKRLKKSGENNKDLALEDYKLEVEFKYKQAIGINESILNNIVLHKSDLVFIGDGHANWFYLNRQMIKEKYGIEIEEYYRDKVIKEPTQDDLIFAGGASDEHLRMEDILRDEFEIITEKVEQNERIEQHMEVSLIQRTYDAVSKNRVTDGNPHFVGTWDLEIEPRGLFEVYFEEPLLRENGSTKFVGKIEDCLGSATIQGELHPNSITFTKRYYNSSEGSEQPVYYNGKKSNGEIVGEYRIPHPHRDISKTGFFKMKQLKEI